MNINIKNYKLYLIEKHKFKELERNWIYKICSGGNIDAIHLCRNVSFTFMDICKSEACSSCGDPVPFAFKVHQTKYA